MSKVSVSTGIYHLHVRTKPLCEEVFLYTTHSLLSNAPWSLWNPLPAGPLPPLDSHPPPTVQTPAPPQQMEGLASQIAPNTQLSLRVLYSLLYLPFSSAFQLRLLFPASSLFCFSVLFSFVLAFCHNWSSKTNNVVHMWPPSPVGSFTQDVVCNSWLHVKVEI